MCSPPSSASSPRLWRKSAGQIGRRPWRRPGGACWPTSTTTSPTPTGPPSSGADVSVPAVLQEGHAQQPHEQDPDGAVHQGEDDELAGHGRTLPSGGRLDPTFSRPPTARTSP